MTHAFDIETLQELCAQAVTISYNTDTADVLSFSLKPEAYKKLMVGESELKYLDRIELFCEGRLVFSGIIQQGISYGVQAGSGESVSFEAHSDYSVLERIAYCRTNSNGDVIYPTVSKLSKFASLGGLINGYLTWAKGSGLIESTTLVSDALSSRVPAPEGNSFTSCASLITESMRWVPDAVMVNRYESGVPSMQFVQLGELEHLTVPKNALLTSVQLQAQPDAVPPFCALLGGDNFILPEGASLQQQNGFIFPVPVDREDNNMRAGSAPNSQKMVIKGIPVPDRCVSKNCAAAFNSSSIVENSNTHKFLKYFFPKYKEYLPYASAAACVVSVVPAADLVEDETEEDEDAKKVPANYSEDPTTWGAGDGYDACYVMTEGSFNASSRASKNLKGLRWCKASLSVNLSISADDFQSMPDALKPGIDELFPGRNRRKKENSETEYTSHKLVNLKLDCVLINRRKRIYDPATNKPCSTDAEYDESAELTVTDYRECLRKYYEATRTLYHEGNIELLHDGTYMPETLTGKSVTIAGKRAEWESMNAVIRGVTWNYEARTLSLNVGSVSPMSFDTMLQRRLLAKSPILETEQRLNVPFDVKDDADQKERELEMSVSPSISASVSGAVSGKYRQPFTLYEVFEAAENEGEEDKVTVYLAGGVLKRDGQVFNVPDTAQQIVNGETISQGWELDGEKLKLKWARVAGQWVYSITQEITE